MRKLLVILFGATMLLSCRKTEVIPQTPTLDVLNIPNSAGIKLQSAFVTTEVLMNVKLETAGTVTIKIFDISNKVVSKETLSVVAGDNILKVYTNALPSSAYRIGLFDSNNKQIGITDFNKL